MGKGGLRSGCSSTGCGPYWGPTGSHALMFPIISLFLKVARHFEIVNQIHKSTQDVNDFHYSTINLSIAFFLSKSYGINWINSKYLCFRVHTKERFSKKYQNMTNQDFIFFYISCSTLASVSILKVDDFLSTLFN